MEGEFAKGDLDDDLTCQCKFYRQYQLPCCHLWQFHFVYNCFKPDHWKTWAHLFDDCGFEVYEGTTKTFVVKEIHDQIDGPSKHMLNVREVLDHVKNRFYELEEDLADADPDFRERVSSRWVLQLQKLTGPIRHQGAMDALAQLEAEGHDVAKLEAPEGFRRIEDFNSSEAEG